MNKKEESIEKLKEELMDRYVILMLTVMSIYTCIFIFYIPDKVMSWYLSAEILFLGYTYLLMRRRFSTTFIVHLYLMITPLYNFYIILAFWEYSVASFCWLLPIPLGAYVFFSRKEIWMYTLYVLSMISVSYFVANNFSFDFPKHTQKEVLFTDTMVFISNILVVSLLIYYNDKIRKAEMFFRFENIGSTIADDKKTHQQPSEDSDTTIENMEKLFSRIEDSMNEKMLFKDTKFNLSALSVELDVNNTYISRAIRSQGYPNFNNYLNTYRINHVKQLLSEVDFQKATFMYVYTEAGFSNQSTFNRVFKQIEGITPSEYFQKHLSNTL
ncbi:MULTISPECIES: helix-turn-helix domain-containing protein [Chryseobacterium]|uniref:AraC-like DNA-binding protein/preprotein translocase subunit SecE n=1 Tax=Chryseobacterium camelliae TaxID=1265445 RepID=A0ABU0TNE2_9FLAO|nr:MULTISPECIES: helix-turn-helix domain-containing protein [Chryseobacterium]MDT3407589.1 AraC-like DNA-binding protein/preprotein translocase subunit SecE [Pseudacidovorax intermedius]MDQ1098558.1 AraC-like DNA-binding protein/preprotein translocase subunit SecE [Chryseobacterium camelliae]MDQ1102482.1 AraC-like DNA-binding protein/preprotein translocase subunit SecE [Chryseobacterium sp. SORGH_AS_1048]MDR6085916.1 AraC-like DNA-binding protein/preprotein translocase subunit SecE [Chryseobact